MGARRWVLGATAVAVGCAGGLVAHAPGDAVHDAAPTVLAGRLTTSTHHAPMLHSPQRRAVSRAAGRPSRPAHRTTSAVTGIPTPCAARHPYPQGAGPAVVAARLPVAFGIRLSGSAWTQPANAPLVRIVWQSLDAMSCTNYLAVIRKNNPSFTLNAQPISGYAWGDWGLTRPGAVTLDFTKWQTAYRAGDRGRLVRLLVHEMGHAWSQSRDGQATYERFQALYPSMPAFGTYAHSDNEAFSEAVGYYVARCATGNPYDSGKFAGYYQLVRTGVFRGHQFAGTPGQRVDCSGAR